MMMVERYRPSLVERLLRAVCVIGVAILSGVLVIRAIPMYLPRDWAGAHELDAIVDWKAARLYFLGVSPYSPEGLAAVGVPAMGHPPTTAFWFLPLAESPKAVVVQLSTFLVWVLLPVHAFLCAKALKFPSPLATTVLVAAALFASPFVVHHCDATQLSEPMAVLYVLAWWFLRTRREAWGGACLGFALSMKLFPGVMLIMLLVARRFRAFFAATLAYLAIAAGMTRTFGMNAWLEFFHQQGGVAKEWLGSIYNSSLGGLVLQLITPECIESGHPSKLATAITVACSLVLLALASWVSLGPLAEARTRNPEAIDVPFALFALLSVFLNAWVWDHYFVFVVQPLFILAAAFSANWRAAFRSWCDERRSTKSLLRNAAIMVLAALGLGITIESAGIDAHKLRMMQDLWFVYRLPFYHHVMHLLQVANFAVWVVPIMLCFMALRLRGRVPEPEIGGV